MTPIRRNRGFTLVELLVTLAVVALVMTVVVGALIAQQRAQWSGSKLREAQAQARSGLAAMERDIAMAGYGIHPALGVDFNIYRQNDVPCLPTGGGPTDCRRDNWDGPGPRIAGTDEIVVYFRDPEYWGDVDAAAPLGHAWRVTAMNLGASQLTLAMRAGDYLPIGLILQLVCPRAARVAYVTVAAAVNATADGMWPVTFRLAQAGNPFSQPGTLANACFTTTPRAFVVHRRRYFTRTFNDATGTPVPYLMLDAGIDRDRDNDIDDADLSVIGEGIEDLQVSYERPLGGNFQRVAVGRAGGTPVSLCSAVLPLVAGDATSCPTGLRVPDFAANAGDPTKWSGYWTSDPLRQSPDAANIAVVHVAVTGRALMTTQGKRGAPIPLHFNRDPLTPLPAAGEFERAAFVTSVEVPNLWRSTTIPYL